MAFISLTTRHAGVLTGPAGCSKSTTLHVLAKEMGFDVCEWQPPVPTLWHEHRYHSVWPHSVWTTLFPKLWLSAVSLT